MDPQKWTPLWTRSMDFPCGSPLIFEDEFYQRSKWILGTFKIMDETAVSLYYQAYGLHILYCTRSNFLEFRTWIRFIWWKNNNISVVGWKKSPTQTFFFCAVELHTLPRLSFPWWPIEMFSHLANLFTPAYESSTKWLAYNCYVPKLVKRLSNHNVWKYSGHFVLVP